MSRAHARIRFYYTPRRIIYRWLSMKPIFARDITELLDRVMKEKKKKITLVIAAQKFSGSRNPIPIEDIIVVIRGEIPLARARGYN